LADLQRMVYSHSGHPSAEGQAQDRVTKQYNLALEKIG